MKAHLRMSLLALSFSLLCASVCAQAPGQSGPGTKAEELRNKAADLIKGGSNDQAIVILEDAIRIEPRRAELHILMGKALANKSLIAREASPDTALIEKAEASLRRALELNPALAEAHYLLGQIAFFNRKYEDAVAHYDRAIKADFAFTDAYAGKWRAMLKRPEFEKEIPKIRAEIESLLSRRENRVALLRAAIKGYELLGDDDEKRKVEDRLMAEAPESDWAHLILLGRALEERDRQKQADMIETYVMLKPDDPNNGAWYGYVFRTRANTPGESNERVAKCAEAWIRFANRVTSEIVGVRVSVADALAERGYQLERAQQIADEVVKIVRDLETGQSPLAGRTDDKNRAQFIAMLKERALTARGFVLLKRGYVNEAAEDLNAACGAVIKQVEKDGFILWRDMDLREIGVRPRVLWLAELYEAQGELERAAKYLLAGYTDDERVNAFIRERLPVVYQKLGRSSQEAEAALKAAASRYRSMTEATPALKEAERQQVLAPRTTRPAPDFKLTMLDKKEVRLSNLKGKVVVLNFWATWCGPCVAEMPHFQKVVDKYRNNPDVVFLAVSVDDNRAPVRPFIEKNGYRLAVAYGNGAGEIFAFDGIPTMIIIARDGTIAFRDTGFGGAGESYIERLVWRVDELLKEQAPNSKGN
ncbi:MAG TPA: redoxin family protein [Blastocatellia bacterium]|nr:redoxin family protein [Blastocatellia bacterium]